LHEFGHHLSGKPAEIEGSDGEKAGSIAREEEAWVLAEKELMHFPELESEIDHFYYYKKFCLDSHMRALEEKTQ